MSITLKRPMFRKGGQAEEGIMELATPRKNFDVGTALEMIQKSDVSDKTKDIAQLYSQITGALAPKGSDILTNLLIQGGLRGMSQTGGGSTLANLAKAFEKPTATALTQLQRGKTLAGQGALTGLGVGLKGDLTRDIAQIKKKTGYESGTRDARFKVRLQAASKEPGFNEVEASIRIDQELNLQDAGKFGNYKGPMVNSQGQPVDDAVIENNDAIPDGSIFYDSVIKQMKIKKDGKLEIYTGD
tara:strand:- start:833 stop:1561 length:729 start_codon:yes stop_codon:yes gene_type:complete